MKAHKITANGPTLVRVTLSHQANVLLMTPSNYSNYTAGRRFRYDGGWYTTSPVVLRVPEAGDWYLVVQGNGGRIRYKVELM